MEHSVASLPEPEYLARIGALAYTVSSVEWMVLGDLGRLASDLPDQLTLTALESGTTSQIAVQIKAALSEVADGATKTYLIAAYRALFKVATIRNDVLHARPATHPSGSQRLNRAETADQATTGNRFWIDDEWLDSAVSNINQQLRAVSEARPAFA
jgi:hypothetical protein